MKRMLLLLVALLGLALVLNGVPLGDHARTPIPSPQSELHPALDMPGRNKGFTPLKHAQRHNVSSPLLTANAETTSNATVYQVWTQLSVSSWGKQTWYANISIGTPPQPFTVAFCSYWGDSWVIDVSCNSTDEDGYPYEYGYGYDYTTSSLCNGTYHQFNSTASSTYASTDTSFEDSYPALFGPMGSDTLRVGPVNSSQLVVPGAEFAQINYIDDPAGQLDDFPVDGVLGLGTQSMSYSGDAPLLAQAVSQGIVSANTYTVYQPISSPTTMLYTLGGVDTENCGTVPEWIPTNNTDLRFTIDSVHMGSVNVTNNASTGGVFLDMPVLVGYTTEVGKIVDAVGAESNGILGIYQIKCDAVYDPLTFVINGQEYNVTSAALTIDIGLDDNWCMFAVNSGFHNTDWALGTPLLRQFCVSFDLDAVKMGLALVNGL